MSAGAHLSTDMYKHRGRCKHRGRNAQRQEDGGLWTGQSLLLVPKYCC